VPAVWPIRPSEAPAGDTPSMGAISHAQYGGRKGEKGRLADEMWQTDGKCNGNLRQATAAAL